MNAESRIDWDNLPEQKETSPDGGAYATGWSRIINSEENRNEIACIGKSEEEKYEIPSTDLGAAIKKAGECDLGLRLEYVKVTDNFSVASAGLEKVKCADGEERFVIINPFSFRFSDFSGNADFRDAQFSEKANFENAQFSGNAIFEGAQFGKGASFSGTRFKDQLGIDPIYLKKLPWWVKFAWFFFQVGVDEEKQWRFWRINRKLRATILDFHKNTIRKLKKVSEIWGFKHIMAVAIHLLGGDVADSPIDLGEVAEIDITDLYTKRIISDDMYLTRFRKHHPRLYRLWLLSSDCGRSISLWAFWSSFFAFVFGFIFDFFGTLVYSNPAIHKHIGDSVEPGFWQAIYFSVVTFTTLGTGDINIKQGWGQMIAGVEVVLGYVMLGGLIAIFANKIARRS